MTLKEATEAARQLLPIIYNGIEYKRINEVGVHYNNKGEPDQFIQLVGTNCVVVVEPAKCSVKTAE